MSRISLLLLPMLACLGPVQAAWSEDLANTFVYYAAAAICGVVDNPGLAAWTCFECQFVPEFVNTHNFQNEVSGVAGYMGHSTKNKTLVLAFQGTANAQGFVEDFTYPPTDNHLITYEFDPSGKSKVEDGFYLAYLSVQQYVLEAFEYYSNNPEFADYDVWVTGHSLGAALSLHGAMQAYVSLPQATKNSLTVYNYGQPRVGDTAFADFYIGRIPETYVQINNSDPVPRLPPRSITQESGFGLPTFYYTRNMHEIWYQQKGDEWIIHDDCVIDAGGEAPCCSDSDVASLGIGLPDVLSVQNHLVYQYHSMLCNIAPEVFSIVTALPSIPNQLLGAGAPLPDNNCPSQST